MTILRNRNERRKYSVGTTWLKQVLCWVRNTSIMDLKLCCLILSLTVAVLVWRQLTTTSYKLIGINTIIVSEDQVDRYVEYTIPSNERLQVQAGDMIGWAFSEALISVDSGDSAVGWFRNSKDLILNNAYNVTNRDHRNYAVYASVMPNGGKIFTS